MAPPAANSNELVAGTEVGNARVISPGQHDPTLPGTVMREICLFFSLIDIPMPNYGSRTTIPATKESPKPLNAYDNGEKCPISIPRQLRSERMTSSLLNAIDNAFQERPDGVAHRD